ncbi:YihY/virulence factor BrkB family protein [Rhizobium sp. EC-SD404]|uniref:YihY/virulence factor BrkB family protein n=1 Tax=Rhizobium sp. EC-SD404 TaxID=2038389 RepID=UPI001252A21B|nr:YihY/virulence factor BrkB family protein [Rhizobium sp. EC-SD404]VVS96168.1 Ribonuclease [Rhizobium sp. EC-SD404]
MRRSDASTDADGPGELSTRGWWATVTRVFSEIGDDRIMLTAAGVTFYLLLALFPALAAFVSVYGFVADPQTIADHVAYMGGLLPTGGLEVIEQQLTALAKQETTSLSVGFLAGFAIALWSANSGMKSLFDAMNIVYDEEEKRSFIIYNAVSLAFTFGGIVIGIILIIAVGVVPALMAAIRMEAATEVLIKYGRWPFVFLMVMLVISIIYRYGPSRDNAKWRWITWGSGLATLVWIVTSIGFSWYLENFADYNATYGSLGAVIGFMMWTWISVMILLIGAELNAELEHQTARDTTTGPERPMGQRGAEMADSVVGTRT